MWPSSLLSWCHICESERKKLEGFCEKRLREFQLYNNGGFKFREYERDELGGETPLNKRKFPSSTLASLWE